jgi:hypothetical protein
MIGIKIDNLWLDLPENFTINFVKSNPMFATGMIEGDFSYQFSIPASASNMRILNYPTQRAVQNVSVDNDCQLYLSNIFWREAVLRVKTATRNSISVKIYSAAGEFSIKTANKKLKDIEFGLDDYIPEAYKYTLFTMDAVVGGSDVLNLGINAPAYLYPGNFNGNLLTCLQEMADNVNLDTGTHGFTAYVKRLEYVAATGKERCQLLIRKAFDYGINADVITMAYNFGDVTETDKINNNTSHLAADGAHIRAHMLNLLNTYYCQWHTDRQYRFPMVMNNNFAGDDVLVYYNKYDGNTDTYNDQTNNTWVPFFFVKWVVEKMLADCGYTLTGSFFDDSEIASLILYNSYSADWLVYTDGNEYMGDIIYPGNHMPDISCGDLLNALKSKFCLSVNFNAKSKQCSIIPMKEIVRKIFKKDITNLSEPMSEISYEFYNMGIKFSFQFDSSDAYPAQYIKDLTQYNIKGAKESYVDLPSSGNARGDIRLVKNMNLWCEWNEDTTTWDSLAFHLGDKTIGNGLIEISTAFSPVFCRHKPYDMHTSAECKQMLPWVSHPGTSNARMVNNTSFGARLLFWRGLDTDEDGLNYPLASYEPYDFNFDRNWNYSLQWDSEYGLIAIWWLDYINFMNNLRPEIHFLRLSAIDVIDFMDTEKLRIDGIDYLMKQLKIQFNQRGIEKIEAELYNVNMFGYSEDYYEVYDVEPEPEEE